MTARPLRHSRVLALFLLGSTLSSGCATTAIGSGAVAGPTVDDGAAVRVSVLEGLAGAGATTALQTPAVIGLTADRANQLIRAAGLTMDLIGRGDQAIASQSPGPGEPPDPSGVVQVVTGPSGSDASAAASPQADVPSPPPATAAADPLSEPSQTNASGVQAPRFVLPPHTVGRLRVNPRQLPALPLGTQLSGRASWYGPGFHGRQTACGGTYDQNGPTLATRELRCGTVVRITGPSGLTVQATVSDWGPAEWTGRRFDLSAAVFNAIAPLGAGVVDVTVVTANVPS